MKTFLKICFLIVVLIITFISTGFVFSKLWGWFIVTTFKVQPLTIIQAIALSFFISYLKMNPHQKSKIKTDVESILEALIIAVSADLLMFVIGWAITLFI